jgi:four helix bundle protein
MVNRIQSYQDLLVWQKSMDVPTGVCELAGVLCRPRWFALADQLQRSAISVPSNIAEGHRRRSRREFVRFVSIANGSLRELETQLILLARVRTESGKETTRILALTDEVGRMLVGLYRSLSSKCV